MTPSTCSRVTWLLSVPPAALLLLSAVTHINNSYAFLSSIYSYRLFDRWSGVAIAAFLPFVQLGVGLAILFSPRLRSAAILWCAILYLSFLIVQISALARGLNVSCGCFGSTDSNPIGVKSMSVAAGGLVLSVTCLLFDRLGRRSGAAPTGPEQA